MQNEGVGRSGTAVGWIGTGHYFSIYESLLMYLALRFYELNHPLCWTDNYETDVYNPEAPSITNTSRPIYRHRVNAQRPNLIGLTMGEVDQPKRGIVLMSWAFGALNRLSQNILSHVVLWPVCSLLLLHQQKNTIITWYCICVECCVVSKLICQSLSFTRQDS